MTSEELKKLNRAELLELLLDQIKLTDKLQLELDEANAKLESRNIDLRESGSIAEAALKINDVFASADAAAKQYLDNSIARADQIVQEATELAEQKKCEADTYWSLVYERMERLYQDHAGLRELQDAKPNDERIQRGISSEKN